MKLLITLFLTQIPNPYIIVTKTPCFLLPLPTYSEFKNTLLLTIC